MTKLMRLVVVAVEEVVLVSWRYSGAESLLPNLALEELVRSVVVEVGRIAADVVGSLVEVVVQRDQFGRRQILSLELPHVALLKI